MIEKLFIMDTQSHDKEIKAYGICEVGTLMTWRKGGKNYQFGFSPPENMLATISPTQQEIIIIHGTDKLKIIDGEGAIRLDLIPPTPISEQSKGVKTKNGDLRFLQFGERTSKSVISVWIGFGYDWFEVRELDLKNGKFGASTLAGRL